MFSKLKLTRFHFDSGISLNVQIIMQNRVAAQKQIA